MKGRLFSISLVLIFLIMVSTVASAGQYTKIGNGSEPAIDAGKVAWTNNGTIHVYDLTISLCRCRYVTYVNRGICTPYYPAAVNSRNAAIVYVFCNARSGSGFHIVHNKPRHSTALVKPH